jgi:hypothetical protein
MAGYPFASAGVRGYARGVFPAESFPFYADDLGEAGSLFPVWEEALDHGNMLHTE